MVERIVFDLVVFECSADASGPRLDEPGEALGGQALEVVLHISPPGGDDAGDLEVVEQTRWARWAEARATQPASTQLAISSDTRTLHPPKPMRFSTATER